MHMSSKNELVRAVLERYLKATKEEKTKILDELCSATKYKRKYAIAKLRDFQRRSPAERELLPRKKRKKIYGIECLIPLKKVWEFLEWPCGERLKPYLPEIVPKLTQFGNLVMPNEVKKKLFQMSISTIDRILKDQRKIRRRKYQCTTKPGTLLKHQIPVRKELWGSDTIPGFGELDLVAHCGMENAGEYVSTLSYIDIATTWIEHAAIIGKSQKH